MKAMVNQKEISFVVQGPIVTAEFVTKRVLNSIRRWYPNSIILLSTWDDQCLEGLDYDILIQNADPGAKWKYLSDRHVLNNNNRQIVSSINGLNNVKTAFAVKTRTDTLFTNSSLTALLAARSKVGNRVKIYEDRLVSILNLAINPRRQHKMPYHPSDFFFTGNTSDLIKLFDIPLMSDEQVVWFEKRPIPTTATHPTLLARYANEQYILIKCLEKMGVALNFGHAFDVSNDNIEISEIILGDNFELLPSKTIGIHSLKYPTHIFSNKRHVYTRLEFEAIKCGRTSDNVESWDLERKLSNLLEFSKSILRGFKH